jgi:short-subunit dehydrogenase
MSRHAVVIGASSGIGRSIAALFRAQGHVVSGLSRHEPPPEIVDGWFACDVVEEGAVPRAMSDAVRRYGVPDVAVYASGAAVMGETLEIPCLEARAQFDVNLWGFDALVRSVLPEMLARGRGTVAYVSSVAAIRSLPHEAYYAASKAAAARYAGCLDQDTRRRGVRVKSLHVGYVPTGFLERSAWHGMAPPAVHGSGVAPDDVARAMLHLVECADGEAVVGWRERVIALADRVSPRLYDRWLDLMAKKTRGA